MTFNTLLEMQGLEMRLAEMAKAFEFNEAFNTLLEMRDRVGRGSCER